MVNVEKNNLKPPEDLLSKNAAYFALLIIIVLGLFLRVYDLGSKSFWDDEIISITGSERIVDMNSFLSPDPYNAHPPLYFLILKLGSYFGGGEVLLRLFSVFFGLLSIPAIFLLAKQFFDLKTSVLASFLLSISPFLLRFDREVRMYSLFMFLTVITILFFIKALKRDKNYYWVGYVFFMVLTLYTHYHSFLVLASTWLFFFLEFNTYKSIWRKAFISQVVIAVFYSFWLLPFIYHYFLYSAPVAGLIRFPSVYGFWIKPLYLFYSFSLGQTILPWNYHIVIPGLILFMILFLLGLKSFSRREISIFFGSFLFFPIVLGLFITELMPRYFIFICPVFYLLIAGGINRLERKKHQLIMILFLTAILSFPVRNYYLNQEFHILANVTPWREVGKYIKDNFHENDILINVGSGPSLSYYSGLDAPTLGLNAINKIKEIDNIPTKNIWVVVSNPAYKEAADSVLIWMNKNYKLINEKKYFIDNDFDRKSKYFNKNFLKYRVIVYLYRKNDELSNLVRT